MSSSASPLPTKTHDSFKGPRRFSSRILVNRRCIASLSSQICQVLRPDQVVEKRGAVGAQQYGNNCVLGGSLWGLLFECVCSGKGGLDGIHSLAAPYDLSYSLHWCLVGIACMLFSRIYLINCSEFVLFAGMDLLLLYNCRNCATGSLIVLQLPKLRVGGKHAVAHISAVSCCDPGFAAPSD